MRRKLYDWQKKFLKIHGHTRRVLLCAEAGTGKTIASIEWLKLRKGVKGLVIAPLGIQKKWVDELKKWKADADVVSNDQLKKIDMSKYKAIIVDECQNFCASLFDKTRSQRATHLYTHLRAYPDTHVFLASATPIRSKPENLHTLACYLGIYWDIHKFRAEFMHITNKYGRYHYEPNHDWRIKIRQKLERIAYIVNMSECADVPVHEHTIINVEWTKKQETLLKLNFFEPAKEWHARHRAEQSDAKWLELEKILDGHAKVVVVCYYLDQIADYVKRIGDSREVFVLTGSTKNQGEVIEKAQNSKDCIFFVQAGLGAGFDLDTFSVMVFASMSFAFVHLIQMQARINRIKNLHKNQYIYLLGGKCDRSIKERLDLGLDFHPPYYQSDKNNGIIDG